MGKASAAGDLGPELVRYETGPRMPCQESTMSQSLTGLGKSAIVGVDRRGASEWLGFVGGGL